MAGSSNQLLRDSTNKQAGSEEKPIALQVSSENLEKPDIILACGKREFPVHRSVLIAASPYFRSMFASEWKETTTGKVDMPTITAETMEIIVDYLYEQKLPDPQDQDVWDLYLQVLAAVHLFEMTNLFLSCLHKLADNVSKDNFTKLLHVAKLYDSEGLETKNAPRLSPWGLTARIDTFLAQNFLLYSETKEFLTMSCEKLKIFLRHPELEAASFADIVRAILKWVSNEPEVRKGEFENILFVFNSCFREEVKILQVWSANKDIDSFSHALTEFKKFNSCKTKAGPVHKLLFYGSDRLAGHRVMKTYDVTSEQWLTNNHPPFPVLDGVEAVGYSGHVYFFSMEAWMKVYTTSKVTQYCPSTNSVVSTGNLKYPIRYCGAAGLHGTVYVIGIRETGKNKENVVQRFYPATGTCDDISNISNRTKPLRTFVWSNHVYVITTSTDLLDMDLMQYEPLTDQWTIFTNIPKRFNSFTFTFFEEKLLLLKRDNLFVFDVTSKQWDESKFSGSPFAPFTLEELWPIWKEDKRMILARDKEFTLATFDVQMSQWKTTIRMEDFMQEEPFNAQYCGLLKCVPY